MSKTRVRSDVRIQLEGRVETIERATRTWESAAQVVGDEQRNSAALFRVLARVEPRVQACVAALEERAPEAPELQPILARLAAARERFRIRALLRLEGLEQSPRSGLLSDLLTQLLEEDRVTYRANLRPGPAPPAVFIVAALFMGGIVLGKTGWVTFLSGAGFVAIGLVTAITHSVRVVLTKRKLVIREFAAALEELVEVRSSYGNLVPDEENDHFNLTLVARGRAPWTVRVRTHPFELFAALEQLGIKTHHVPRPTEFQLNG